MKIAYFEAANGRDGEEVTFSSGEFVRCDPSDNYYTLRWSSALPVETFLMNALSTFVRGKKVKYASAGFVNGDESEGSIDDVRNAAMQRSDELDSLRINTGDTVLAWTHDVGRSERSRQLKLNQCTVVSSGSISELGRIVIASATPEVGKNFDAIARSLASITDKYSKSSS